MASTDLTAGLPVYVQADDAAAIKVVIDGLQLAAATDVLHVVPVRGGQQVMIFVVERTA